MLLQVRGRFFLSVWRVKTEEWNCVFHLMPNHFDRCRSFPVYPSKVIEKLRVKVAMDVASLLYQKIICGWQGKNTFLNVFPWFIFMSLIISLVAIEWK